MKAREPLPDSSKSNKATSDLMDSSSYIISELEAAYQTPKLWESEEKKPTPDPAKSNTKLKELYLQKFHNIHNIQDSSITPNQKKKNRIKDALRTSRLRRNRGFKSQGRVMSFP